MSQELKLITNIYKIEVMEIFLIIFLIAICTFIGKYLIYFIFGILGFIAKYFLLFLAILTILFGIQAVFTF